MLYLVHSLNWRTIAIYSVMSSVRMGQSTFRYALRPPAPWVTVTAWDEGGQWPCLMLARRRRWTSRDYHAYSVGFDDSWSIYMNSGLGRERNVLSVPGIDLAFSWDYPHMTWDESPLGQHESAISSSAERLIIDNAKRLANPTRVLVSGCRSITLRNLWGGGTWRPGLISFRPGSEASADYGVL